MSMLYTLQGCWVSLRRTDVSADDTALDPTLANYTFFDLTKRDCYRLEPGANGMEVIFLGEGDDTDYFGCRIFGKSPFGPAERIAEISGHYGAALAPNDGSVTVDATTHKIAETILLDASNTFHIRDMTVADCSSNAVAKLYFDTAGIMDIYFEFYNIGDATEVHNIRPYGRYY